jgi:Hint module
VLSPNISPIYDIMYSAEVLTELPSPPSDGWVDLYYEDNGCKVLSGFSYIELGRCQFDYLSYVIDYEALGIPTTDFILDCDRIYYFNTAASKCNTGERFPIPVLLSHDEDKCVDPMGYSRRFTIGGGMLMKQQCSEPVADRLLSCFSGDETATLEDGSSRKIQDLTKGDRILSMTAKGGFVFSPVIALPHRANSLLADFVEITTSMNMSVRVTPDHLIPAGQCTEVVQGFQLLRAKDVSIGLCVETTLGIDEVTSTALVRGIGLQTVITNEPFVVISSIVASPFALNHYLGDFFYSIFFRRSFFGNFMAGMTGVVSWYTDERTPSSSPTSSIVLLQQMADWLMYKSGAVAIL